MVSPSFPLSLSFSSHFILITNWHVLRDDWQPLYCSLCIFVCIHNQTDSVHLSAVHCTFLSSATLQQQRGGESCNSHFFLGYHAITGDRVWFWNGGKTDPSLPSLWGTEDWVSTTQETKQAKPGQQKKPCCNRKIHFARLRKNVWHHCERAVLCLRWKTKKNTVPCRIDCFLMAHTHQIQWWRSSWVIPFIFTASWKTNHHMWIYIIRTGPQLYAN